MFQRKPQDKQADSSAGDGEERKPWLLQWSLGNSSKAEVVVVEGASEREKKPRKVWPGTSQHLKEKYQTERCLSK